MNAQQGTCYHAQLLQLLNYTYSFGSTLVNRQVSVWPPRSMATQDSSKPAPEPMAYNSFALSVDWRL